MTPPEPAPVPLAAPGLFGTRSVLNPPWGTAGRRRRAHDRPLRHARLEIDLDAGPVPAAGIPRWDRFESLFSERRVVEPADLLRLTVPALHALASREFRRVDHWEVAPGGWLPPPTALARGSDAAEPVGQLLELLGSDAGAAIAGATAFSVRVSDLHGNRADVVVRRVHRQRRHAISIDLWGRWSRDAVHALVGALSSRLPIARTVVARYQWADDRSRLRSRRAGPRR